MAHKVAYFLFHLNKETTLKDFNLLLSAINTQTGIGVVRSEDTRRDASIIYGNNPLRADIKFTSRLYEKTHKGVKIPKHRIVLTCELADNLTVNFVKEVGRLQGLKVFSPELGYFLPKDSNLHDCNTGIENNKELQLLEKFGFKPLFWYWNTFTYYAEKISDSKIYIINGHLLRHLIENDIEKLPVDFSFKVSNSLAEFVRKFNIGVIPVDYYKCLSSNLKFYNLSTLDLTKIKSKVLLEVIPYEYDKKVLEYKKIVTEKTVSTELKKASKINEALVDLIKTEILVESALINGQEYYTGAIVEKEIDYKVEKKKYIPKLNLTLYL